MSLSAIAQYLFFSGFLVMLSHETPVVLRHVYKPAINFRHKMELKYGKNSILGIHMLITFGIR